MTYQRDPDDRLSTSRRMNLTRADGSWGVFPAVLGIVFLLLVGLIAYNMYNGNTTGPSSVNPSAQAPATTPSTPSTTPNTTPPATTPSK